MAESGSVTASYVVVEQAAGIETADRSGPYKCGELLERRRACWRPAVCVRPRVPGGGAKTADLPACGASK